MTRRGSGGFAPQPGAVWWRRRFLRVAVAVVVMWIALGFVFGVLSGGERGPDERGGPPFFIVVPIVGVAVLATFVAYRRLAGPVSELLDGAQRIGAGEYDVRVRPQGPRSVRTLGAAFNDMAGRLEQSETARRQFLADITHELRTPIAVLRAEIEAQLDGIHPRDDAHLELLLDQAATLDRLVEDLRTLALGDAGALSLHRETISANVVVDDAVAALTTMAADRDVTMSVVGHGGAAPTGSAVTGIELDADPVRLGQVLTNLLTNAVRHTPPGGTVTVELSETGDDVVVAVVDTGPGIAGDPERLFDRFARSADSGGTGLGLTIARQLVEAHGGMLVAANEPGGGARFTATLPREQR